MNDFKIRPNIRRKKYFRLSQGNFEIKEDGSVINGHNKEKENNQFLENINLASELGFMVAIPLIGGVLLGTYLDRKFYSEPKFTLSFIFLGIFLSLYNIYVIIKKNSK